MASLPTRPASPSTANCRLKGKVLFPLPRILLRTPATSSASTPSSPLGSAVPPSPYCWLSWR
eukprot:155543-Pelagomonas_calceolata.AAC.1